MGTIREPEYQEEQAEKQAEELSRRNFMKGLFTGAAGITAAVSLGACAPQTQAPTNNEKTESSTGDATPEKTQYEPTRTVETDIVVIGGGGGGLAAAIQASQLGHKVILLEKEITTGGTSAFSEGLFAINSHWQQEEGIDYTTASVLQKVMDYHHWMADAELTKHFFDASGETIGWLEEAGVVFMGPETLGPSLQTWHTYEGMGMQYTQTLLAAAQSAGAEIWTSSPALQLVVTDKKVVGVICSDDNDEIVQIDAKAVVLASGGYADNADMINEYTMHNYEDMTVMGSPNRTGDGVRMALELDADTHVIGTMMMCGGAIKDMVASSQLNVCAGRQPMLWINEHGERFANEGIVTNFSFTGNAMGLQKKVFNIIDGATMDQIINVGCYNGRGVYVRPGEPLTEFPEEWDREVASGNPFIFKADSLEELATLIEVDLERLIETIDTYNSYCDGGEDLSYGKVEKYLQPVRTAPFYAFKLAKAYYCSVGGLKVNTNNQVLTVDGEPIIGLYAVGCDAGGLYGSSYDVGIAAGSQQGWAVNGGRFAVKHASETLL
jgi:fumarate reductase flavoprotein subunit